MDSLCCCCCVSSRSRGLVERGRIQISVILAISILAIALVVLTKILQQPPLVVASASDAGRVTLASVEQAKGVVAFSLLLGGEFCQREQNFLRSIATNQCEIGFLPVAVSAEVAIGCHKNSPLPIHVHNGRDIFAEAGITPAFASRFLRTAYLLRMFLETGVKMVLFQQATTSWKSCPRSQLLTVDPYDIALVYDAHPPDMDEAFFAVRNSLAGISFVALSLRSSFEDIVKDPLLRTLVTTHLLGTVTPFVSQSRVAALVAQSSNTTAVFTDQSAVGVNPPLTDAANTWMELARWTYDS